MSEEFYDAVVQVTRAKQEAEAAGRLPQFIERLRLLLHDCSPLRGQPVDHVRWVPIERVTPNDYNPNSVARIEMGLLYTSISHDGYTQPVVTIYDPAREPTPYVIVDGFHRYYTMLVNKDIRDRCLGLLPVVVIDKPPNDRMASTVRHNRARGKHSVQGMSSMVFCLVPATRLLTSDLRWIPISSVVVGDELIAFDEELGRQKMRRAAVIGVSAQRAMRLIVRTDKGEVTATPNHQWVITRGGRTNRLWCRTDELRLGDRIAYYCEPWGTATSYDAGWMAGFLDGEGFVHRTTSIVGFAQNPGPVLDRALSIMTRDGFKFSVHSRSKCCDVRVLRDMLRFIGYYRPTRLLPRASALWEGKQSWSRRSSCATVLEINQAGEGDVCGLSTTTGTIVAEGMLSHNTMLDNGWSDQEVCNEIGLSPEELLRLKHVTGFSKLFADVEYQRAWETRRQVKIRAEYRANHPPPAGDGTPAEGGNAQSAAGAAGEGS